MSRLQPIQRVPLNTQFLEIDLPKSLVHWEGLFLHVHKAGAMVAVYPQSGGLNAGAAHFIIDGDVTAHPSTYDVSVYYKAAIIARARIEVVAECNPAGVRSSMGASECDPVSQCQPPAAPPPRGSNVFGSNC